MLPATSEPCVNSISVPSTPKHEKQFNLGRFRRRASVDTEMEDREKSEPEFSRQESIDEEDEESDTVTSNQKTLTSKEGKRLLLELGEGQTMEPSTSSSKESLEENQNTLTFKEGIQLASDFQAYQNMVSSKFGTENQAKGASYLKKFMQE